MPRHRNTYPSCLPSHSHQSLIWPSARVSFSSFPKLGSGPYCCNACIPFWLVLFLFTFRGNHWTSREFSIHIHLFPSVSCTDSFVSHSGDNSRTDERWLFCQVQLLCGISHLLPLCNISQHWTMRKFPLELSDCELVWSTSQGSATFSMAFASLDFLFSSFMALYGLSQQVSILAPWAMGIIKSPNGEGASLLLTPTPILCYSYLCQILFLHRFYGFKGLENHCWLV